MKKTLRCASYVLVGIILVTGGFTAFLAIFGAAFWLIYYLIALWGVPRSYEILVVVPVLGGLVGAIFGAIFCASTRK